MNARMIRRTRRFGTGALMITALGACSTLGGLGGILGGGNNQVYGTVQSLDTRSRQIGIQQSNGQTAWLGYDNNTQVVYQNQVYSLSSLERGDQVTASVQDNGNGSYYASSIQVTQSVSGNGGRNGGGTRGIYGGTNGSSNVQTYQGTVRQVDRGNGWFIVDDSNFGRVTVLVSNNLSRADANRFNSLRSGEYVRLYGYRNNNSAQVQLQQFY